MWGGSWSFTLIVGAFAGALVAMSFAFAGGAVIVALPVALVVIGIAAVFDLRRRQKQIGDVRELRDDAKAEKVDFTERDKETLISD
ncbi:MAG: hypothetical protein ABR581_10745 [Thermoleophilaceae bacterium]